MSGFKIKLPLLYNTEIALLPGLPLEVMGRWVTQAMQNFAYFKTSCQQLETRGWDIWKPSGSITPDEMKDAADSMPDGEEGSEEREEKRKCQGLVAGDPKSLEWWEKATLNSPYDFNGEVVVIEHKKVQVATAGVADAIVISYFDQLIEIFISIIENESSLPRAKKFENSATDSLLCRTAMRNWCIRVCWTRKLALQIERALVFGSHGGRPVQL